MSNVPQLKKPLPPVPMEGGTGDRAIQKLQQTADFQWQDFSNYYANDGPKFVFICIWIVLNLGLFGERFYYYAFGDGSAVTGAVGYGIPLARGAAGALKLNCALILFTVMRNFLSCLRITYCGKMLPLDKNIVFHKGIAWAIAFWTAVHQVAHMMNYHNLAAANPSAANGLLGTTFKAMPSAWGFAFTTIPGATGHLLVFVMCLMYTSAILSIRRPFFEMFWYTHHLFIVFFILLCVHGLPGLLEPPNFYLWFILPGLAYGFERFVRVLRGNEDTVLHMAIQHPSKVLELRMKKCTFDYVPGQYLMLNCPAISKHEWHPFTITSAPEEDFVSVHIRIVGDWTGALQMLFNPDKRLGVVAQDVTTAADGSAILRIDGAFGAASEEVFGFENVVLVGAGIGVTPFASIMKSIRYKLERSKATGVHEVTVKNAHFFWISRDRDAFEWFSELLKALERENIDNFLHINLYMTGGLKPDEIRTVMYGEDDGADAITGLQARTYFGRPEWPRIFDELEARYRGAEIGVFFCGPSVLSKMLYQLCRERTMDKANPTTWKYHKENF